MILDLVRQVGEVGILFASLILVVNQHNQLGVPGAGPGNTLKTEC